MSQTQLASMFLGNPHVAGRDSRLKGIKSTIGNIIHITHGKTDEILDIVTAKHVIDNVHFKSIETGEETFDFEVVGERSYDQYLVKGNRVVIPGESENDYVEFVIDRVIDSRNNSKDIEVFCYASFIEVAKAKVIEPFTFLGTAEQHLARAISGTEHEVGVVESAREITISFSSHTEPFEYIRRIASEFDLESNFRAIHNGTRVTNRPIDLLDRIGAFRGREFTFGKDLEEIRRIEDGDIYTALIGIGPEDEDGHRNEVFVEDLDSLSIWGRPEHDPQHLIGVYEPESDDSTMSVAQLRQYTQTELNKRKSAIVKYEMKALDMEHIVGHSEKITRFGDTIRGKDTFFSPPLFVEARIFEMRRNVVTPMQKEYKFGDFVEYSEVDVHALFNRIKRIVDKKAGIAMLREYAEPKRIESDTAPTGRNEHVIWVDTSTTPYVPKVFNGGQWVKLSPTTPGEVNAYTKSQVDSKASDAQAAAEAEAAKKAAQALADAKAFSKNADNITEGVIDVGAIPLRTSITGARLEWDGVNGLIQYDSAGNPVSWINLDADAHFANAFLSGRIEALEGYFGDNIRLRDGKMEIVRPDGAISMSDGMVDTGYVVTGRDPHHMRSGLAAGVMFPALSPGNEYAPFREDRVGFHYYGVTKGIVDGRGDRINGNAYYSDRRDDLGKMVFQGYDFVHSARYLVFDFHKQSKSTFSVHVMDKDTSNVNDRIYFEKLEKETTGKMNFIIDLGKPSFKEKSVYFNLGWANSWGPREEVVVFRVNSVYLTDFI